MPELGAPKRRGKKVRRFRHGSRSRAISSTIRSKNNQQRRRPRPLSVNTSGRRSRKWKPPGKRGDGSDMDSSYQDEGHHEHPSTSAVRYQGCKEGKRRVCRNSDDNHEIFLWQCFDKLNRLTHYLRMNKTAEAEKKQKNADP